MGSQSALATAPSPSRIITVDYSIRPNILPIVAPGERVSLAKFSVAAYANRPASMKIDVSRVMRVCPLESNELEISGYEAVRRISTNGRSSLDLWALEAFLRNRSSIPTTLREGLAFFAGKILEDKFGDHFAPCLSWNGEWWTWYCHCLRLPFGKMKFFVQLSS